MYCVGTIEGQSEDEDGVCGAGDDAHKVRSPLHAGSRTQVHHSGIMQRPTGGSIGVICQGCEQAAFTVTKSAKKYGWVKQMADGMLEMEERRPASILGTMVEGRKKYMCKYRAGSTSAR